MTLGLINANPVVHAKRERFPRPDDRHLEDAVDPLEIYDILFLLSILSKICHFSRVSRLSLTANVHSM